MITISICMIVKNEEAVLDRCLSGFSKVADEIIIVDTGSTDRTKEIAQQYTDKIYDYTWIYDFADARNYAFSLATKDYILCIDADEILDEENQKRLLMLKQAMLPEIDIVQMYYCNQLEFNTVYNYDKEYRPKLYKRLRTFTFIEPIHETVRLEPIVFDSDVEIIHKPLSGHADRDFKGFLRMHENGQPLSSRLHNMYAKELFIAGETEDFIQAIPVFLQTFARNDITNDMLLEACCVLARAYRVTEEKDSFFQYAMKGVCLESCSELCYEIGEYFWGIGNVQEASIWYYNAIHETQSILYEKYQTDFPVRRLEDIVC